MSGPAENAPTQYLAVTSQATETLVMAFHGDEYVWEPGETLNLSEAAARHIFGFGMQDKAPAFHRLGWLNTRPDGQMKDALSKLKQFTFMPVQQVFQMSDRKPRKAKASGSDRSLAVSGAEAAGDDPAAASQAADEAF